jgi:histone deacetylase complex regulatory component SIN3
MRQKQIVFRYYIQVYFIKQVTQQKTGVNYEALQLCRPVKFDRDLASVKNMF